MNHKKELNRVSVTEILENKEEWSDELKKINQLILDHPEKSKFDKETEGLAYSVIKLTSNRETYYAILGNTYTTKKHAQGREPLDIVGKGSSGLVKKYCLLKKDKDHWVPHSIRAVKIIQLRAQYPIEKATFASQVVKEHQTGGSLGTLHLEKDNNNNNDKYYIDMMLLPFKNLSQELYFLDESGKFVPKQESLEFQLKITIDLLKKLDKLHQDNISHNDVNWTNVLLDRENGEIHIIDFDLVQFDPTQSEELFTRMDVWLVTKLIGRNIFHFKTSDEPGMPYFIQAENETTIQTSIREYLCNMVKDRTEKPLSRHLSFFKEIQNQIYQALHVTDLLLQELENFKYPSLNIVLENGFKMFVFESSITKHQEDLIAIKKQISLYAKEYPGNVQVAEFIERIGILFERKFVWIKLLACQVDQLNKAFKTGLLGNKEKIMQETVTFITTLMDPAVEVPKKIETRAAFQDLIKESKLESLFKDIFETLENHLELIKKSPLSSTGFFSKGNEGRVDPNQSPGIPIQSGVLGQVNT